MDGRLSSNNSRILCICYTCHGQEEDAGVFVHRLPPTFALTRTRTKFGEMSFRVAEPTAWNSLLAELRTRDISSDLFRKKLKTVLFDSLLRNQSSDVTLL